jgi:DNA excision repair protein ERCC-8
VHFGPRLRNTRLATLLPLITPDGVLPQGKEILFYPNDEKGEILMFELYEGTLLKVLRVPGLKRQQEPEKVGLKGRVAALAWRGGEAAGLGGAEIYSAHGDGTIRAWISRTKEEMDLDDEERKDAETVDRKRKMGRDVLGEIVEGLAGRNVRFT